MRFFSGLVDQSAGPFFLPSAIMQIAALLAGAQTRGVDDGFER
jgi:hypothetical protein